MNSVVITTVLIPGFVSVLLFLVFTYLHEQSRQPYFRAWQLAWAAYSLHYVLDTFPASSIAFFVSELFLVAMALCILISTRVMRGSYQFRWYDAAVGSRRSRPRAPGHCADTSSMASFAPTCSRPVRLGLGLAAILLYCLCRLLRERAQARVVSVPGAGHSVGALGRVDGRWTDAESLDGHVRQCQPSVWPGAADAARHRHGDGVYSRTSATRCRKRRWLCPLWASIHGGCLFADELVPSMQAALERLSSALPHGPGGDCNYRTLARSSAFSAARLPRDFSRRWNRAARADYICELAYPPQRDPHRPDLAEMTEPLPVAPMGTFADFKRILTEADVRNLTAINLQTREHNFGVILFPHAERRAFRIFRSASDGGTCSATRPYA